MSKWNKFIDLVYIKKYKELTNYQLFVRYLFRITIPFIISILMFSLIFINMFN